MDPDQLNPRDSRIGLAVDKVMLEKLVITTSATLMECLGVIDKNGAGVAILVSDQGEFRGLLTDGDIRRALMTGAKLGETASRFMQQNAAVVSGENSKSQALGIMHSRGLSLVPVIGPTGQLAGVYTLRQFLPQKPRPNVAVVMAGGRGSRLGELTARTPKPMINVAGRPIIDRIVAHLVSHGIREVVISVGYLGDQIENFFRDGSQFGCHIQYLREEDDHPLGTAGSLSMLSEVVDIDSDPVLCVNGDVVTEANLGAMIDFHVSENLDLCVGSSVFSFEVPFGVLHVDGESVVQGIEEKPTNYSLVNAGIYSLSYSVIDQMPRHKHADMTDLISQCLNSEMKVKHWDCGSEWIDVGQPDDLAKAQGLYS